MNAGTENVLILAVWQTSAGPLAVPTAAASNLYILPAAVPKSGTKFRLNRCQTPKIIQLGAGKGFGLDYVVS